MVEEMSYSGLWWLPENDDKTFISGTLKLNDGNGILEIIGSTDDLVKVFGDKFFDYIFKSPGLDIILGITVNNEKITLVNNFLKSSDLCSSGVYVLNFFCHCTFMGAHFKQKSDIKFKSVKAGFFNLDNWFNVPLFSVSNESINYVAKDLKIIASFDKYNIFLETDTSIHRNKEERFQITMHQQSFIKIEPVSEEPFSFYRKILFDLRNFFNLAFTKPTHMISFEGISEVNKEHYNNKDVYPPIRLYQSIIKSKNPEAVLPEKMLFTYNDSFNRLEGYLKNYFEKVELLDPIFSLYFSNLYRGSFLETKFLIMAQAIEAYHRRAIPFTIYSTEEYTEMGEELLQITPEKYKEWVKGKLEYGNEPSLQKRLKFIYKKYEDLFNKNLINKDFLHKVVVTRNYLTHYDEKLKAEAANDLELFALTQKLNILFIICLLNELGFTIEEIRTVLIKHAEFREYIIQAHDIIKTSPIVK